MDSKYKNEDDLTIRGYTEENGGQVLCPKSYEKPPKLLIVNEEGKFDVIVYDDTDEDMKIRLDDVVRNGSAVSGVCRHGCEQMFGSMRQFGALAKVLDQKANRPIGQRIVLKFGLNRAYINVNRHVMMYLLCALLHNTTHKKFPLNYATAAVSLYLYLYLPYC